VATVAKNGRFARLAETDGQGDSRGDEKQILTHGMILSGIG
jgi:hypothetical protein